MLLSADDTASDVGAKMISEGLLRTERRRDRKLGKLVRVLPDNGGCDMRYFRGKQNLPIQLLLKKDLSIWKIWG